jgi:hypothetical protein
MNVPEITEIKEKLEQLKSEKLIKNWELPYENILTRRSAALFFVTPESEDKTKDIWTHLEAYENFSVKPNDEKKLSDLAYVITFSEEEKKKNTLESEAS